MQRPFQEAGHRNPDKPASENDRLFAWEPALAVGVDVLDREHRRMFELASAVAEAARGAAPADELAAGFEALKDFTARHFDMEERLMEQTGYARSALHSEQHKALLNELDRLGEQLLDSAGTQRVRKALGFLRGWVAHHIQLSDRDFARHLLSRGIH